MFILRLSLIFLRQRLLFHLLFVTNKIRIVTYIRYKSSLVNRIVKSFTVIIFWLIMILLIRQVLWKSHYNDLFSSINFSSSNLLSHFKRHSQLIIHSSSNRISPNFSIPLFSCARHRSSSTFFIFSCWKFKKTAKYEAVRENKMVDRESDLCCFWVGPKSSNLNLGPWSEWLG